MGLPSSDAYLPWCYAGEVCFLIGELILCILALVFGAIVYFPLSYIMKFVINNGMAHYPQYYSGVDTQFALAVVNWGLVIFVIFPIAIFLWNAVQRPRRLYG